MDKESLIDKALAMLGDDMDDLEGKAAMSHSMDDCPDPLNCTAHDDETGAALGKPDVLSIEVHKPMNPGDEDKDMGGKPELTEEESEMLKKLFK